MFALDRLYEPVDGSRAVVADTFLALCVLATFSTVLHPPLLDILGGIEPRRYPWQVFTAAFVHGWPGFHGLVHLGLNTLLILECGRPCERLLGRRRFLTLGLLALAGNAVALSLTEGVNGSSLVIWSWGPSLLLALRWARVTDHRTKSSVAYSRIRGILILMYVVITVIMALVPYMAGWRGNPVVSLLRANVYHIVATAVGSIFALYSSSYIRSRLEPRATSKAALDDA